MVTYDVICDGEPCRHDIAALRVAVAINEPFTFSQVKRKIVREFEDQLPARIYGCRAKTHIDHPGFRLVCRRMREIKMVRHIIYYFVLLELESKFLIFTIVQHPLHGLSPHPIDFEAAT